MFTHDYCIVRFVSNCNLNSLSKVLVFSGGANNCISDGGLAYGQIRTQFYIEIILFGNNKCFKKIQQIYLKTRLNAPGLSYITWMGYRRDWNQYRSSLSAPLRY